jgi:hypothetical protein
MKNDFGNYLFNVVIGFLLLLGGMSVADDIARTASPSEVPLSLYISLWSLAVLPFCMFYFWAKPTGNPLWMDFLFSAVTLSGLVTILVGLPRMGMERQFLSPVAALWGISCYSAYFGWIAPTLRQHMGASPESAKYGRS